MLNLRSKITTKLLDYFLINPKSSNYVNELAKILEVDPGNLYRKLREFEDEGLLISETRGNQRYYSLNKEYPLLNEIKKTYEAKYGLVNKLKEALKNLSGLEEVMLYGSFANGKPDRDSDIDLLLIGDHNSLDAMEKIRPIEKLLGREINSIDMTRREFEKRKEDDDFLKNVLKKKPIKIF